MAMWPFLCSNNSFERLPAQHQHCSAAQLGNLFLARGSSGSKCHVYMVHTGSKSNGYFDVFAKQGQPPGWHYSQYDFRPAYQYFKGDDEEKDKEIKFDQQSIGFQTGIT